MKKVISLVVLSLLLTSCFGKTKEADIVVDDGWVKVEIGEWNINISWDGVDVKIEEGSIDVETETWALENEENEDDNTSLDVEVESETEASFDWEAEEVMEDFEKEINDLFKMIEEDNE